ncbi:ABC transporter substrate-binding protein [Methylovirgula sp. 4M-Z18]|uniref:ABC transporter substrate-binding protein n=1 Tax=Methylovirgula sp. 4M-Z18 TaxID=2293567 RepID=UPI000E2FD268|nr:ABC transporter substrate-binding protein [Methylovirgula sp. 4M-Z18]RFB79666.1 ABC transporter substrate-binding protein [Methylovirgula sp. 4M-Z18]
MSRFAAIVALWLLFITCGLARADVREAPYYAAQVQAGKLPPVYQRIPDHPRIVPLAAMGRTPGRYGGTLRMLMNDPRDIRFANVYSYARLVAYDEHQNLVPDILESFDIVDDRIFTFHLRPGHKWSDGYPFTTEDFRYTWEDFYNNKALSPGGPPREMIVDGEPPKVDVIDAETIRYSWSKPNPAFLPALAAAQPLYLTMPAHYLRQFHDRYADPKALSAAVKTAHVKDWTALHERMSRQYRPDNPDLPTLEAWRNTTKSPSEFYVFERNPYYHRVDENGHQLPYIDKIEMPLVSSDLIPSKTGGGESDLQARYLSASDYTLLQENAKKFNYHVYLWPSGYGAAIALRPNLNAADPVWRKLMQDTRFRQALSLGIDRQEINDVVYFGLARPVGNSVLPESTLYDRGDAQAYASYDPQRANELLDEIGLTQRDANGVRLLSDGRPLQIVVETDGDSTTEDVMQLVIDKWHALGVHAYTHLSPPQVFRMRAWSGEALMSVGRGWDVGLPSSIMPPNELSPDSDAEFQWPKWGQYVESSGAEGDAPDLPEVKKLVALRSRWRLSSSHEERRQIWQDMLKINAEQVYLIGIVNGAEQPVVVSDRLQNVPRHAIYSFAPNAFFGVYMPDTFWFNDAPAEQ